MFKRVTELREHLSAESVAGVWLIQSDDEDTFGLLGDCDHGRLHPAAPVGGGGCAGEEEALHGVNLKQQQQRFHSAPPMAKRA